MKQDLFVNVGLERKRGSPTRDSATNTDYPSRNKTYQALAPSFGLDPNNQYGWYTLCRVFLGRFIDVKTGRPIGSNGSLI
jgi:hypothetical protein